MKLTIGVDFGNKSYMDSLHEIIDNNKGKVLIESVYGAIPMIGFSIGGAREVHRISGSAIDLNCEVRKFNEQGVKVNYVCNSLMITPNYIALNKNKIKHFFQELKEEGVSGIIIASPLLIHFVKEAGLEIIMSTILHINSINMIEYYVKQKVNTIVLSLYSNRDFSLLRRLRKFNEVKFELMVNEACINPCPWRIQHYIQESLGEKSSYYFSQCYNIIKKDFPFSIISGNFIIPEEVIFSKDVSILIFNISFFMS